MIDIIRLAECNKKLIEADTKFMIYGVIAKVFKSKAKKAIDDGDINGGLAYIDVLNFCVDKKNELVHELEELNKKIYNF